MYDVFIVVPRESLPDTGSQRFYPEFSSGSFIVLDSTFRPIIYF